MFFFFFHRAAWLCAGALSNESYSCTSVQHFPSALNLSSGMISTFCCYFCARWCSCRWDGRAAREGEESEREQVWESVTLVLPLFGRKLYNSYRNYYILGSVYFPPVLEFVSRRFFGVAAVHGGDFEHWETSTRTHIAVGQERNFQGN
jgi:hypothetical protein